MLPVLSTAWPWLLAGCRLSSRLWFGAPSCVRTHKQVPAEGKWRVPAAAGAPSQQQHLPSAPTGHIPPPLAPAAPQAAGRGVGDAGRAEVCGHGWRGSSRQTPTRCPHCHPGAILLRGHCRGTLLSWGDTSSLGGCPSMGYCSPRARLQLEGTQGGDRGPGLSRQPAVTPEEPSQSVGPCWGWGSSRFPQAAETLFQSESRGVS